MNNKNIVFIGFMGCGKTTIGEILACSLNKRLFDTDCEIEKDSKMQIPHIFKKYGEHYFRELEKQKIKQLSKLNNIIITTGGGAILDYGNIETLKKNGIIIYLKTTPKQIYSNLKKDHTRPLIEGNFKKEKIQELMGNRAPLYEAAADFVINVTSRKPKEIIEEICLTIKE